MSSTSDISFHRCTKEGIVAETTAEAVLITNEGNRLMFQSVGSKQKVTITSKKRGLVGTLNKAELGHVIEVLKNLHEVMR